MPWAALALAIGEARAAILKKHVPAGFNIGVYVGKAGGQTVPHLHVHVIPRYRGDVADPRRGVRWVVPGKPPTGARIEPRRRRRPRARRLRRAVPARSS